MKALVVQPGGFGDVLLAGPAVRAVAAHSTHVTLLCSPLGEPAARLLPGVDDVIACETPWEDADALVRRLGAAAFDSALVLTSSLPGPLPSTRLLRRAGVGRIGAEDADECGRLLDVRHLRLSGRNEAEARLDAAIAMGFRPHPGDDGLLRVLPPPDTIALTGNGPYLVVHPGAGTPRPAWSAERCAEAIALLAEAGHRVVVTGGPGEADLTRRVSGDTAVNLGGRTAPRTLAGILRTADVVVTGDPGPAQLAAAVRTPVVSLTAPPLPYGVPSVPLGDESASSVLDAVRGLLGTAPGRH